MTPALPPPAHSEVDSMLTRKFGREVANYFSGSPLNRVGFLRGDSSFLSSAVRHPSTSFLLCNNLQPLVTDQSQSNLAFVKHADVKPIIGNDPYSITEEELIAKFNSEEHTPQMIFLGLDEKEKQQDSRFEYRVEKKKQSYGGRPYFAVDVTPRKTVKEAAESLIKNLDGRGLKFATGRAMELNAEHAAIFAEARQLLDWNARNPFCAQCGQPTLSVNAGFKRTCPPSDQSRLSGATSTVPTSPSTADRPDCATRKGVSNLCFPRTDPTVIMAVVNSAGTHILLGRSKRFPPAWYSTLAGFCEPAESVEEAVRREVWEEAGIHLGRVVVHSTQPWPYPANLMIGAVGQSVPGGETIDLGNDPELEDAKWYTFEEVREALRIGVSGIDKEAGNEYKGGLRLPPPTAIANQLISSVVNGLFGAETKI